MTVINPPGFLALALLLLPAAIGAISAGSTPAAAQETSQGASHAASHAADRGADQVQAAGSPVTNPYCAAVVDAAADARFAWQAKTLEAMRLDIEERAARLEEKRAETERWLTRRQEFLDRTEERIVTIYARMRADAAAAQIAAMQDDAAVALLSKIDTRSASAILNEMEPGRAAHLTGVVTGILKRTSGNQAANRIRNQNRSDAGSGATQ